MSIAKPSMSSVYSTVTSHLHGAFLWGAASASAGITSVCTQAIGVSYVAAEILGVYSAAKTMKGGIDIILSYCQISDAVEDLEALRKKGVKDLGTGIGGLAVSTALMSLSGTFPTAGATSLQAAKVLGSIGGVFCLGAELVDPCIWGKELGEKNCAKIRWTLRGVGAACIITGTFVPTLSISGTAVALTVGASCLLAQKNKIHSFIQALLHN